MNSPEELAEQLSKLWGGQTLATLRDEATRELNGTCFKALRTESGPRRILLCCVTGEYEIGKLKHLDPAGVHSFGDWNRVSLFEAVGSIILSGGFGYDYERSSLQCLSSVVFIAAVPDSITKLERLFGLSP